MMVGAVVMMIVIVPDAAARVVASPSTTTTTTVTPAPARSMAPEVIRQVSLINRFRVARGLSLLRLDAQLTASATWMARDMATKDYFAHQDSRKRGWFRRLRDFRYPVRSTWTGENLAAGHETAQPTHQQWLTSIPHRRNMLNPRFRAIGIARVFVEGSTYGWYWVTDFGSARSVPLRVLQAAPARPA